MRAETHDLPHYFPKPIDFSKADDSVDEDASGDEDAICEVIGYELGEGLSSEISEPFTEEELHEAYVASGYYAAKKAKKESSNVANRPKCMWQVDTRTQGGKMDRDGCGRVCDN